MPLSTSIASILPGTVALKACIVFLNSFLFLVAWHLLLLVRHLFLVASSAQLWHLGSCSASQAAQPHTWEGETLGRGVSALPKNATGPGIELAPSVHLILILKTV